MLQEEEEKSVKKPDVRKILPIALICLFGGIFVFSGVMLFRSLAEYRKENAEQSRIEQDFLVWSPPEVTQSASASSEQTTGPSSAPAESTSESFSSVPETAELTSEPVPATAPGFSVDWQALSRVNPDVVGWIWIPDTGVNYPVLLGDDNAQYLYSTLEGEYARFGSIFADYRTASAFWDKNTVVYGHNGGYGVKFGCLTDYLDTGFFDDHSTLFILTPEENIEYRVYSAYVTKSTGNPYTLSFDSDTAFESFLDRTVADSAVPSDTLPGADDKILTLSTCTNNARDERFVVHAFRVN